MGQRLGEIGFVVGFLEDRAGAEFLELDFLRAVSRCEHEGHAIAGQLARDRLARFLAEVEIEDGEVRLLNDDEILATVEDPTDLIHVT